MSEILVAGVLWKGDHAVPGTPEVMQILHRIGKKIFYVTNNSTKSSSAYVRKCLQLGFPATKVRLETRFEGLIQSFSSMRFLFYFKN
jgi:ribonucleotide monophosphatase NagD (HAD superfamily)